MFLNRQVSMIRRVQRKLYDLAYDTGMFSALGKGDGKDYRSLLQRPRYVPGSVMLGGKEFVFADARSFYYSYREIFLGGIYEFATDRADPLIIDCGSSYGTSILYFKTLFPAARIIGFEADPYIFEFLSTNIATYRLESVEIFNRAVWFEETELNFQREYADSGRLTDDTEGDIIRVRTAKLSDFLTEEVDLLKVDIEGAEVDVLTQIKTMENVRRLFVEYHSFAGKPQRLDEVLSLLYKEGYRYQIQTQLGSKQPFIDDVQYLGMDMQLNIFASRPAAMA